MRITLAGHKDDQVTLGHQVWCAILELGQMYGWRPQGTRVEPQRRGTLSAAPWDGTYLMAAGQLVADSDAQALAGALRRALDDVPDHDAMEPKQRTLHLPLGIVRVITTCEYTPIELLSGANKRLVEQLIGLAERSAFCIGAAPLPQVG